MSARPGERGLLPLTTKVIWVQVRGATGVTAQPSWRISRADLDKLMMSLQVGDVRLSECALGTGSQIEIVRSDYPTIYYVCAGSGALLVEGEAPIDLSAHTLVVVPARKSMTIGTLDAQGSVPRTTTAGRLSLFIPGASPSHQVGQGEPVLRVMCGSFSAVYAAGFDLFSSQVHPIIEIFDPHDQLDQVMNCAMVEHAAREVGCGPMSSALLKLALLSLMRRCLTSANPWVERFSILNDPPIARAFAEMASRPSARHTVDALSQSVGLSRSAFMARFSVAFGESPMAVLRRIRMRHAAGLLAANALSIDQVAIQAGYQSRSSFTRTFRRHFGNDPSEFRAEAKRDAIREPPNRWAV